ncbi:MAG: helix-turn-helix domain-containing protein [Hyphomicrobiales bacterium]|nr:helix-turn-helix domain-containing protein [Hyphomicrobiales bacterium]
MNQVSREKDQAFDRAAGPSIGALLRASRERCGEDLGDVAELLCIRYPYLVAIEEGRFADLPGKTYATGFVRAYAEHLGLDAEEVVRRFKDESTGIEGGADLHFPSPVPESTFPTGAVLVIGLVVAGLAYGGWQLNSARDGAVADLIAPLPDRLIALLPGGKDGAEPLPPPTPMPPDVTDLRPAAAETSAPAPQPAPAMAPATEVAAATPPATAPPRHPRPPPCHHP